MVTKAGFCGLLILTIAMTCWSQLTPQQIKTINTKIVSDTQPIAQQAFSQLQQSEDRENFTALGVRSIDEAKRATLGPPFPLYRVSLIKLREYTADRDPISLLISPVRILYPVLAAGKPTSLIEFSQQGEKWNLTTLGRQLLASFLFQTRQERAAGTSRAATDFISVASRELNQHYLGEVGPSTFFLTALIDDSLLDISKGARFDARQLFVRLVPSAKQVQGRVTR